MFDPVSETLQKATELSIQMQQEMLRKWVGMWPTFPTPLSSWGDQIQRLQKKWAETVDDSLAKQREVVTAQFEAGMKNLEGAFKLAEAKDPEELRVKIMELWKKTFENLQHTFELQLRNFQASVAKCTELLTRVGT